MSFISALHNLLAQAKTLAASKQVTLPAMGKQLFETIDTLVVEATTLNVPGPVKKAAVLDGIDTVLATLITYAPLPWYLNWLKPFLIPFIHQVVVEASSGAIEAAYARVKAAQAEGVVFVPIIPAPATPPATTP